jgi:hypothetical protein
MDSRNDDEREDEEGGIEFWLTPYLTDFALLPVTLVVIAHAVAFLASVMVFAVRDRMSFAIAGLGLLGYGSFLAIRHEARRTGSLGALTAVIIVTWLLSMVAAYVAGPAGYL